MNPVQPLSDEQIIESWKNNVKPWIAAIQNNEIASRTQVTNQAIVTAIAARTPENVLDVGCGEGWLVRELVTRGIDATGVDVIPEFIDNARQHGIGRYRVLPYEEITSGVLTEKYDVVVCNFSLLGKESVHCVFRQIPLLLKKHGAFIVQTIHPVAGCGDGKYADGWRKGSWAGFSEEFCDAAPWYFRTLDTWKTLFAENGFTLNRIDEPMDPKTQTAASIIFVAEIAGR